MIRWSALVFILALAFGTSSVYAQDGGSPTGGGMPPALPDARQDRAVPDGSSEVHVYPPADGASVPGIGDAMTDGDMLATMHPMMQSMGHMMTMMSGMMGGRDTSAYGPMLRGEMNGPMHCVETPGAMGGVAGVTCTARAERAFAAPTVVAYHGDLAVHAVLLEASDPATLAEATGLSPALSAPVASLARISPMQLGDVYVFANGVPAFGPGGFQPPVLDSAPGDREYTPLRAVHVVTWREGLRARVLTTPEEIAAALETNEIMVDETRIVVNMPVVDSAAGHDHARR